MNPAHDGGADAASDGSAQEEDASVGDADGGVASSGRAIFDLGDACDRAGELGCSDADSALSLVCEQDHWVRNTTCGALQRCDTRLGATQGQCLDLVSGCADEMPGHSFCDGDAIATCGPDRVTTERAECDGGYTCTLQDGEPVCIDVDECEADHGGCDPLTDCMNTAGAHACGACPAGYLGTGDSACTPTLTQLALSSGTLEREFDPGEADHEVSQRFLTPTITLTPAAPPGAGVTIEGGTPLDPGEPWTSPVLRLGTNEIAIEVAQTGHPSRRYTLEVELAGEQEALLAASNLEVGDSFGLRVAVSGDTLVVGARQENGGGTGVNDTDPGQGDNSAPDSGAAYVFVRDNAGWTQQAYVKASNTGAGDMFGTAVAVSGDTLVVGAPEERSAASGVNSLSPGQANDDAIASGAVYVFVRTGETWFQQAYIKASNTGAGDRFGFTVAVSGNTLAVGAYQEDSASSGVNDVSPGQADDSADSSGAVYVFVRDGTVWTQQAYIKASNAEGADNFGAALALSGETLVVGASVEDSGAAGVNPSPGQADNGLDASGAVYAFVRSGTAWTQQAYIKASEPAAQDNFGDSVAILGDTLVVGAHGEDSASIGVDHAGVGHEDNGADGSGAAYVFVRSGTTWTQQAFLKASNPSVGDAFGDAVAVGEDIVVVSAVNEDSAATGFNGTSPGQDDNGAPSSGAVYVFGRSGQSWAQQTYLKADQPSARRFGWSAALSGQSLVVGAQEAAYVFR